MAELPAPFSVHWSFVALPLPGLTVMLPVEAALFAKANRFLAGL